MEKDKERLAVIENIKKNLLDNNQNLKVEIGDPRIPSSFYEEKVAHYDIFKRNPINKIKNIMARKVVYNYVNMFNSDTKIVGLENLKKVEGGAIITSNHFSPQDSTPITYALKKIGKHKKLRIVITEANLAMDGQFGFIMNNFDTIPLSKNKEYTENKFMPAIEKLLKTNHLILIYPEQEMWFNYRKVRNLKPGAYHIAAKFGVPIIPCFITMEEKKGEYEENGFNKLRYTINIMEPIYPDKNKSLKENKTEMQKKDYELKKKAYEETYNKELTYEFSDEDIAGFKEDNK